LTDIAPDDYAHAIALQWDGKIVLGGVISDHVSADFALVRYK
jgi:hypothetical protein